jgi:hypothetical protein
LYAFLTLRCGISPEYVLDKMRMYEMRSLLSHYDMKTMEQWEMTRTISFFTAQSQSAKPLDIKSMIPFPWDGKRTESALTDEDKRNLTEMLNDFIDKKNGDKC